MDAGASSEHNTNRAGCLDRVLSAPTTSSSISTIASEFSSSPQSTCSKKRVYVPSNRGRASWSHGEYRATNYSNTDIQSHFGRRSSIISSSSPSRWKRHGTTLFTHHSHQQLSENWRHESGNNQDSKSLMHTSSTLSGDTPEKQDVDDGIASLLSKLNDSTFSSQSQMHYITRHLPVRASALYVFMQQQPPFTVVPHMKLIVSNVPNPLICDKILQKSQHGDPSFQIKRSKRNGKNVSVCSCQLCVHSNELLHATLNFAVVRVSFFAESRAEIHLRLLTRYEIKLYQQQGYKMIEFTPPSSKEQQSLLLCYSTLLKGTHSTLDPENISDNSSNDGDEDDDGDDVDEEEEQCIDNNNNNNNSNNDNSIVKIDK